MKTVVFAYHDMGCIGITELITAGFDIVAIFTHPDSNNENQFFSSVAVKAAELNIPIFAPEDINHPLCVAQIKALAPDYIFSFYYRQLLNEEILSLSAAGAFNLHGSLLPKYRGRSPLNWVLINGESETGVTLHRMSNQADAGDIVAQQRVSIDAEQDALGLHQQLLDVAQKLLKQYLPLILNGQVATTPQNSAQATYVKGRTAEDGEINWSQSATQVHNLIRGVAYPWPGARTNFANNPLIIWQVRISELFCDAPPGTVISTSPLVVACGEGAIEIIAAQPVKGVYLRGAQFAEQLGLVKGARFHQSLKPINQKKKILILGVNGFIGNHLTERLLRSPDYEVYGLDIGSEAIKGFLSHPRFHFVEGDISIHSEWIEYHIKKCDVILPLVAIATPIEYTRNPLRVFELDFEENLKIIRYCVRYNKRVIFPSTSEVYGMCQDEVFDEDNSTLVVGPIHKQRWIYSVSKQLLDRVIWAYGKEHGLNFTLFRPFNWMGPRLDNLNAARIGSSRAITQLILNLVEGTPIKLIDGGKQKRCFTDIDDGIEALFRIIENKNNKCDGQIINIGNPNNEASICELAEQLVRCFEQHPLRHQFPPFAGYREVESQSYYGQGYQDVEHRRPSIRNAQRLIDWQPSITLSTTLNKTLDFFLNSVETQEEK